MTISELIDQLTGERKYLNAEERKAFFEATTYLSPDVKYYTRMLYYTGGRLGEALAVTPDFIDYKERCVIFKTLKQNPNRPKFRMVEPPDAYLESPHDIYNARNKKGTPARQKRLWNFTTRTARNYINAVMTKAKISGIKATSRGLRHSMGVNLVQNNVPLHIVQGILGHVYIENTRMYAQALEKERRAMIARVW